MRFKVFISSVQREFAAERQMLAEYVRKDALLGKFFDVFLFEEEPACDVEARNLYLPEVEKSDIYLGILGAQFGNADADGVSPTEREYDLAAATLLTTHESVARNKVIAKALDWAGYVERSGHGTEFIIEKCEAQGLATPQYKPDSAIFHTIIWRKTMEAAVKKARLTPRTGGVVDGVEAQSGTSQGQVAGGVGNTAESVVAQSSGPVAYQVAYDVAYQVAYQNVPGNTAGRIFLILKEGPLGRADIAKTIGVTRMARSLKMALDTLLEDGLIEYTIPDNVRSRLQKYRLTEKGRQMLAQKGTHE